ncbi:MAG: hypothetical protein WCK59_00995 [Candidatus Falkowbacteria bacterium]
MNGSTNGRSFSSLPRPQRTAVVVLGILALVILGVWFWQFNMRLNSPFRPTDSEIALGEKVAQDKIKADNALKTLDSDGDGLSDYDEINIYKTSPYLEDTDGDGISDFQEVKNGTDPLCAAGTDCSVTQDSTTAKASTSTLATSTSPAENVDQTLLIKALSGQGDADTMRQILLQGGANPDQVKLLTDQDLMDMYKEVLKAQNPDLIISTSTESLNATTSSNVNQ